jgi:lauroyl/myristoyl acyltransferase
LEEKFAVQISTKYFLMDSTVEQLATLIRCAVTAEQVHPVKTNVGSLHQTGRPGGGAEVVHGLFDRLEGDRGGTPRKAVVRSWGLKRRITSLFGNSLPYPLVFKFFDALSARKALRAAVFRRKVRTIRDFVRAVDSDVRTEYVIRMSLLYGSLFEYRIGRWGFVERNHKREQYSRRLSIEGERWLEEAINEKHGVVLVSGHNVASRWTQLVVPNRYMVGTTRFDLGRLRLDKNRFEVPTLSQKLDTARRILKDGGIVGIAADGTHGGSERIEYDFHGRRRPFLTGFAELALLTGATVVPVMNSVDEVGHVTVAFGEPFNSGNDGMSRSQRVERLVDQYVASLNNMWSTTPWMVSWGYMERHLSLPQIVE